MISMISNYLFKHVQLATLLQEAELSLGLNQLLFWVEQVAGIAQNVGGVQIAVEELADPPEEQQREERENLDTQIRANPFEVCKRPSRKTPQAHTG